MARAAASSLVTLRVPSPFALPLMVERFREKLSTEKLADRLASHPRGRQRGDRRARGTDRAATRESAHEPLGQAAEARQHGAPGHPPAGAVEAVSPPRHAAAAKLVALLVLAYALSPIDLIPDFIPLLGLLDDVILLPLGIALAVRLTPRHLWLARLAEAEQGADSCRACCGAR